MKATEVTVGLAESNGSLLPGLWRDSFHTISNDITILHVNLTYEKLSIQCKMFCKLDVRRKLIVTLALS